VASLSRRPRPVKRGPARDHGIGAPGREPRQAREGGGRHARAHGPELSRPPTPGRPDDENVPGRQTGDRIEGAVDLALWVHDAGEPCGERRIGEGEGRIGHSGGV